MSNTINDYSMAPNSEGLSTIIRQEREYAEQIILAYGQSAVAGTFYFSPTDIDRLIKLSSAMGKSWSETLSSLIFEAYNKINKTNTDCDGIKGGEEKVEDSGNQEETS